MKIRKAPASMPVWVTLGSAYFVIFLPQSVQASVWGAGFVGTEVALAVWMFVSYATPGDSKHIGSGKTRGQKKLERQHQRIRELEEQLGIEPSSAPIDFSTMPDEQVEKLHRQWKEN